MSDHDQDNAKPVAPKISSEDAIFDDIRPCRDDEAQQELAKIAADDKLVSNIVKMRYPTLNKWFGPLLRLAVRSYIRRKVERIHSIEEFQHQVAQIVTNMLSTTTDGLSFSGFEHLDPKQGYLFISNHRDISLDPALIDYILHHKYGFDTVRIAIGDNLLKVPAATALMRLNKSFIVKRSVTSPRERLKEIYHLSKYIGLSLEEGHSIWIAQREGRAKDGNDQTEEAVLKMLYMHGRSNEESFAQYMSRINIVPVSITYEYDPGDIAKAKELDYKAKHDGKYQKGEFEDIQSIIDGIKGYKGRVSIVAGKPITGGFETPSDLKRIIDRFIFENYALYPSAKLAAHEMGWANDSDIADISAEQKDKFMARFNDVDSDIKKRALSMYAYPFKNYHYVKSGEFDREVAAEDPNPSA